jgi:glucose-6-phosphate 1-dehydrogenase
MAMPDNSANEKLNHCNLVIFGGTGDLSYRKLLPALYRAFKENSLHPKTRIIPTYRNSKDGEIFESKLRASLKEQLNSNELDTDLVDQFVAKVVPVQLDILDDEEGWRKLSKRLTDDEPTQLQNIFYFSIAPSLYEKTCQRLFEQQLINQSTRVVLEKPIGYDQQSAEQINAQVARYFAEQQIFRIDHYLGKETVQNLLALRFSNLIFENLWDKNSIEHVQISISETVGLESRAGFYDDTGALRDMVQNHLLQLLCLVAMEPPNQLTPESIRNEKIKVLQSLSPLNGDAVSNNTVRGQYVAGELAGKLVPGYLEELNQSNSQCETFVAIKTSIENWRWAGVPFYLRTGKRLKTRGAEIVIQFKPVSHRVYQKSVGSPTPNRLVIQLQPDEKIQLELTSKNLGRIDTALQPAILDLNLTEDFENFYSDAYKRLLLDVIANDPSLFIHRHEIRAAWAWIDPIIKQWNKDSRSPELYRAGSWGPTQSDQLLNTHQHQWFNMGQTHNE